MPLSVYLLSYMMNNNKSKSHTNHGLASTLRMRTAISPGQWQSWTAKAETAVHGCHCPVDMAVRMHKVLVRLWVCVRVSLAFIVDLYDWDCW